MPKTLYVTDLDGTLLNSNKELSPMTRKTVNSFIADGGYFTVATARTAASASIILAGLDLSLPAVLMNGAVIYDFKHKKYIKTETIAETEACMIADTIKQHGISGFMFAVRNNTLVTYYENLKTQHMKEYYAERVRRYYKSFEEVEDFRHAATGNDVIYFTMTDEYDALSGLYNELVNVAGIDMAFYKDVYSDNLWYLEIYSINASKYNAVSYLRNYYGFDRVVGYGDNLNDIPFLKACDEFYAVSNAVDELKVLSTAVIDSNINDGVAKHLAKTESVRL